jgi:hypothetical protein
MKSDGWNIVLLIMFIACTGGLGLFILLIAWLCGFFDN